MPANTKAARSNVRLGKFSSSTPILTRVDAHTLRERLRGSWLPLLTGLAPSLTPAAHKPGKHVPCPVHGGKDGFRFFNDASETGGGVCNTCGTYPDGFAILQWIHGWTFPEALDRVAEWIGAATARPTPNCPRPTTSPNLGAQSRHRQRIQRVWHETTADTGRIAAYLRFRGLSGEVPPALRLHPRLAYFEDGELQGFYPAMVAKVVTPSGETVSLHLTFLSPDSDGKADVDHPKKLLPPETLGATTGCAIHVAEPSNTLAITEGIETGLAVLEATGVPVWAALSAHGLATITVPRSVSHVQLWSDDDPAGRRAAQEAARRLYAGGWVVTVL